ncbi:MAG: hypothetical protein AAGN46_18385, partial [Acidobacteriota bacterium]
MSAALALVLVHAAAATERLRLERTSVDLPAAPAAIVSADLDADGRRDLAVVVVFTRWDSLGIEEESEIEGIEGLVEVLTVVPALFERRELHVFRGGVDGWSPVGSLPIDRDVLSIAEGPAPVGLVAVTDAGLSRVVLGDDGLALVPWLDLPPLVAGTETFIADLARSEDIDGDGRRDLALPTADGLAVVFGRDLRPATDGGLANSDPPIVSLVPLDADHRMSRSGVAQRHARPELRDLDGDGRLDITVADWRDGWNLTARRLQRPRPSPEEAPTFSTVADLERPACAEDEASKREAAERETDPGETATGELRNDSDCPLRGDIAFVGDLDGRGRAEVLTVESLFGDDDDVGLREGMRQAKRPPYRYRLHRLDADLAIETPPYATFEALGYAFDGARGGDDATEGEATAFPGGLRDLDGDGDLDLVTLTLDFSMLQAVRVLTVRSVSIGLDFHVYCQDQDGRFRPVPQVDLSGKFRLDLDNLRMGRLVQFSGDFDGDGRRDFLQAGRGRTVSIHRGGAGC